MLKKPHEQTGSAKSLTLTDMIAQERHLDNQPVQSGSLPVDLILFKNYLANFEPC